MITSAPTAFLCVKKTKRIYVGHHKKADLWLPPGGHIDKNETPKETALREFTEELEYVIKDEIVELINIEPSTINNLGHACRIHYDFWYIIHMKTETQFAYSTKEYYSARWVSIEELLEHNTLPHYVPLYKGLALIFAD